MIRCRTRSSKRRAENKQKRLNSRKYKTTKQQKIQIRDETSENTKVKNKKNRKTLFFYVVCLEYRNFLRDRPGKMGVAFPLKKIERETPLKVISPKVVET
jgi:hypothetical protein